jgi:chemotaxis protein histidine kinase CheA
MDELLAKAAEAMQMPEAMVRRSAEARAKAEDRTVEEVLADWAGVEAPDAAADDAPDDAPDAAADDAPAAEAEESAEAEAEPAPEPEKVEATGIDVFVEAAAEKMSMPASMIRRSAEARARAEGRDYAEVLADWAEADVEEVRAAAEEPEAPEAEAAADEEAPVEAAEAPSDEEDGEPEPEAADEEPAEVAADEPDVEVIGGDDAAEDEDESAGVDDEDADELVGAASGLPAWLMAVFVIIPAFAIAYAAFFPNGPNCGDAGRLAVDPVTGLAVACDGSPYGERVVDFFAVGAELYVSAPCAACHGAGGGGGAGPPFTAGELLATFPEGSCDLHVEWVRLGTAAWPEDTYGANDKPVGGFGIMPGFGALSEEELRSVVLYERVQFGGEPLDVALGDCGLEEADDGAADGDAALGE